ncbi:MAG: hypothetical protein ABUM51_08235 [Bacteroidota bacterium]
MTLYDTAAAHSGVGAVFSPAQVSSYANATELVCGHCQALLNSGLHPLTITGKSLNSFSG